MRGFFQIFLVFFGWLPTWVLVMLVAMVLLAVAFFALKLVGRIMDAIPFL